MDTKNTTRQWREKVNSFLDQAQGEIKKTTALGRRMLTASRKTTELKAKMEELGELAMEDEKSGQLTWNNPEAHALMVKIRDGQKELEEMEGEVGALKNRPPEESSQD